MLACGEQWKIVKMKRGKKNPCVPQSLWYALRVWTFMSVAHQREITHWRQLWQYIFELSLNFSDSSGAY